MNKNLKIVDFKKREDFLIICNINICRAKSPNPTGTPIPSKSPSMMPMPMSNNPVIVNNQPKVGLTQLRHDL